MNFIRELETRIISEADNVWIEPDGHAVKERFQLIGTQVICKVRDENRVLFRSSSFLLQPQLAIENEDVQALIEEHYKLCESYLLRDMKKVA
jgi:hypothetical protein